MLNRIRSAVSAFALELKGGGKELSSYTDGNEELRLKAYHYREKWLQKSDDLKKLENRLKNVHDSFELLRKKNERLEAELKAYREVHGDPSDDEEDGSEEPGMKLKPTDYNPR